MEAEQVVKKILADAKVEKEGIEKQAGEEKAAEQAKLNEQLAEYKKQTEALAQKKTGEEKLHILAAARMDVAKDLLVEKRKILDEVFEKAQNQLENLPDGEYLKIMTRLMLDAVETGDEKVIIANEEKRIDHEFIKKVNRKLGPGYKGNLSLSDERENLGAGFILKRGRIKNNVSLKEMMAKARRELEIELAKELFG